MKGLSQGSSVVRFSVLALTLVCLVGAASAQSEVETQSFNSPGTYSYDLPSSANAIEVRFAGAGGGDGGDAFNVNGFSGGSGALSTFRYNLTEGQTLDIGVGGQGQRGEDTFGNGRAGGGGGGGSSSIRDGSDNIIACAGGGGGGQGGNDKDDNPGEGGAGGGGDGEDGQTTEDVSGGSGGTGYYSTCGGGGTGGTGTGGDGSIDYQISSYTELSSSTNNGDGFVEVTALKYNTPPSFNSSSISPDPPEIGKSVSYDATVNDPDGSVQYTNLTVEYGGSTVVSDAQRSGTTTPSWNDIYTPTTGNKWLNATLEVVDDAGAVTEKEINRYLSDDAPSISLNDPQGQDYFTYDVPLEVEASDSDSKPNEVYSCTVDKNTSQSTVASFDLYENGTNTYSDTVRSDLGSHNLTVTCSDGAGNTDTVSQAYDVKAFSEESVFAPSPVFETENSSFQLDLKTGGMVNSVDFELNYSGSVRDSESLSSSGIETLGSSLYHEAPLVSSNQTSKDWSIGYTANITDFSNSSTYSTLNGETGTQSQEILHAFYLDSQDLDKNQYVAGDDITYTGTVVNETGKASISGTVKNSQKNNVVDLQTSRVNTSFNEYSGTTSTDTIDQSSLSVDVDPEYLVEFDGQSRTLSASNLSTSLEQLRLAQCSQITGQKALVFNTYNEKNRTQSVDSELNFAAEYWNPDTPSQKKVLNFSSSGTSTHEICISPAYASAKIDSTEKLIQYSDSGSQYVLRSYFLINETIDNTTTTIPLYMLESSEAERVRFEVQDENRNPVSNVVIRIQRYFPSVDKQLTTAMVKTGAEGQTETFLETNEIYYAFNLYQNGVLQKEIGQQVIPSDLSLVFTLGGDNPPNWYDYEDTVSHSCDYNATQVTCDYESTTEALQNVSLKVEKPGVVSPITVGESTGSTASGSITVKGFNASENRITYKVRANFDNDVSNLLEVNTIGTQQSVIGETGLMISLFMFLTMSFAGLWKPSASIALGLIALIVSTFLPFLAVGQTALTALIALGAVLVWRMS